MITALTVRAALQRLASVDAARIVNQHAERPFTRRAASEHGCTLLPIERLGGDDPWWVRPATVRVGAETRRVWITITSAGAWRCGESRIEPTANGVP